MERSFQEEDVVYGVSGFSPEITQQVAPTGTITCRHSHMTFWSLAAYFQLIQHGLVLANPHQKEICLYYNYWEGSEEIIST